MKFSNLFFVFIFSILSSFFCENSRAYSGHRYATPRRTTPVRPLPRTSYPHRYGHPYYPVHRHWVYRPHVVWVRPYPVWFVGVYVPIHQHERHQSGEVQNTEMQGNLWPAHVDGLEYFYQYQISFDRFYNADGTQPLTVTFYPTTICQKDSSEGDCSHIGQPDPSRLLVTEVTRDACNVVTMKAVNYYSGLISSASIVDYSGDTCEGQPVYEYVASVLYWNGQIDMTLMGNRTL